MNKAFPLLRTITLIVLVAAGCGSREEAASLDQHDHPTEASPGSASMALSLDGEAKWKLDDHTRQAFAKMAGRFDGLNPETASREDLAALGSSLREDIDALIAGCTMTGDAHHQLHTYLAIVLPAAEALRDNGAPADAKKVHELLNDRHMFFE